MLTQAVNIINNNNNKFFTALSNVMVCCSKMDI